MTIIYALLVLLVAILVATITTLYDLTIIVIHFTELLYRVAGYSSLYLGPFLGVA